MTAEQEFQNAIRLHQASKLQEAAIAYQRLLARFPNHAEALHFFGVLHSQVGQPVKSVELITRAIQIKPQVALFHNNLGTALKNSGKFDDAIAAYRRSIAIDPNDPLAHSNLGNALCSQGKPQEAIAVCRRALELKADYADAHNNLGNALLDSGDKDGALASFRKAIQLNPRAAEPYNNLGNTLTAMELLDDAAAAFTTAIRLDPRLAAPHMGLGFVFGSQGLIEQAFEHYDHSISLDPGNLKNRSFVVFAAHYHPNCGLRKIYELAVEWAKYARPLTPPQTSYGNDRSPDRKLKIGYVSPDFCDHVMTRLAMPIFEHHNSNLFEIHCFSSTRKPDAVSQQIQNLVAKWHDVAAFSDLDMAQLIHREQIDILVDLAVHTTGNRLAAFAYKPAPVQVSYLAYFGTTGLTEMDYILCDRYLAPDDQEDDCFTERKLRLTSSYWCYRPSVNAPPVNSLPAMTNGYVTFGCLNNLAKVNMKVLEAWSKILLAMPSSKLLIMAPEGSMRQRILIFFQQKSVLSTRIEFVSTKLKYLDVLPQIDISLDPFPFGGGGGNTTCEALWMGVPVVKLAGETGVSRGGVSALATAGLTELVTETVEQYISLAIDLAADLPRLESLRSTLRQRIKDSPLMDEKAYVAGLENAYRSMWQTWCDSEQ